MSSAYVLIEIDGAKAKTAIKKLAKTPGIKSVAAVTGPYDAIALVEGIDLNEVGDIVLTKIRGVAGVTKTITCLSVDVK